MKKSVVIVLVVLGLYWLFEHRPPLPLNHEQFGLYSHSIHRVIGVVLLIVAGLVGRFWQPQKA